MAVKIVYLVMRADGNARVTTQRGVSRIGADEVAFRILVDYPNGWGVIAQHPTINLSMPEPPTIEAIEETDDADRTALGEDT